MYFWVGVSAIAGALRRRVWIDQAYFQWYPNLYIILVAPPGIVSKSTTADVGMSLLRQVPGIKFGPSVVTWQSLVKSFAEAAENFSPDQMTQYVMSPLSIVSSEFGNLLNPKDKDMVDMLVNLWDGKSFTKATKMSGVDEVVNPWINILACTTPEWIAGSFPEYMVGGGFTSRCLFVYADQKEKYVAYPGLQVPKDLTQQAESLVHDLEWISSKICGEYTLTKEAVDWGTDWYHKHYSTEAGQMDSVRFGGYIARKQTQAHKVAMVLAASSRDDLKITAEDLATAVQMITDLEPDMHKVFDKIGMSQDAAQVDRLIKMIEKSGKMEYSQVYRWMQRYFPHKTDIEDMILAAITSERICMQKDSGTGAVYFYPGARCETRGLPTASLTRVA
jgi:hypothetical protein